MGNGYTIKCRKCSYEYKALLGCGMLYPTTYKDTLKLIREGKLGEDYKKFFEEHPDAAVNCENYMAICTECGKFETVKDYGLYLPKEGNGTVNVGLPLAEDLESDYKQCMKYEHKCKECGGTLKVVDLIDELSKHAVKCPKCGDKMFLTEDLLIWD